MKEVSSKSALAVVESELTAAQLKFLKIRNTGQLQGDFFDEVWKFRSARLKFAKIVPGSTRSIEPFNGFTSKLARCFLISQIHSQYNLSTELIISRFAAFRYLALSLEKSNFPWNELTAANLNRAVKLLRDSGLKESTVYHRAGGFLSVLSYLNGLKLDSGKKENRFLNSYVVWAHGIENPTRKIENPTSAERAVHSADKYKEDIHVAIASARSKVIGNPEVEPRPGYDRIRLESLIYSLALGLRIGEVLTLPIHALDRDSIPGRTFLRVAVEKGQDAQAVPIPEVWVDMIGASYTYLLEACGEARARARDIELNGFEFVDRQLSVERAKKELTRGQRAQFTASGLNAEKYFYIHEFTNALDCSTKNFTCDGKYNSAAVDIPKPFASKLVVWLDERFKYWDWSCFARKKMRKRANVSLTAKDISLAMGERTSGNISRHKWFAAELYDLLDKMHEADAFSENIQSTSDVAAYFRKKWDILRVLILSNKGGSQSVVVDLQKFKNILSEQYSKYLTRHFDEIFYESDESKDNRFQASNTAPGVEKRLSNHLLVVWEGQFSKGSALGILPRPLFRSDLYNYIAQDAGKLTIFERLNIRDSKGEIYSLTPHMIRHWVNTAMLKSGPNEALIDLWMGRKPRQGRQYDHRTLKERAESIRERYLISGKEPEDFLGRKVKSWRQKEMSDAEISALLTEKLRVVHISPWGSCSRELYTSPCTKSLMCLRGFGTDRECSSFQIDPNDKDAKIQIEKLLASYERLMLAIEPSYKSIADSIYQELNTTESLDQHVQYIMDVIRGCKNALVAYDNALID